MVNGIVAIVEDDRPGGFNNPDGSNTPRYMRYMGLMGRSFLALVIGVIVFFTAIVLIENALLNQ